MIQMCALKAASSGEDQPLEAQSMDWRNARVAASPTQMSGFRHQPPDQLRSIHLEKSIKGGLPACDSDAAQLRHGGAPGRANGGRHLLMETSGIENRVVMRSLRLR
jgi:hypothetical protein